MSLTQVYKYTLDDGRVEQTEHEEAARVMQQFGAEGHCGDRMEQLQSASRPDLDRTFLIILNTN